MANDIQSHEMTIYNLDEMPARERIILTTIKLIEKDGVHGLTTRTIAREANVNIAAINYYFSSKQKLIEESLQFALNHMFSDTADILVQKDTDQTKLLSNIMFYMLEGSIKYTGIIKAMLHEPIDNNNYQGATMQQIMGFIKGLISKVEQVTQEDSEAVKARILQIISVSLMPALLPDMFRMILGEDFTTNTERQKDYTNRFFNGSVE